MKIISKGNHIYRGSCPKCGCIFELAYEEIAQSKSSVLSQMHNYYEVCPQCAFISVMLSQIVSDPPPAPVKDAFQPITAQELFDFSGAHFTESALVYVYINGVKWPVMEMSDDNGDLVLITNNFNERPSSNGDELNYKDSGL